MSTECLECTDQCWVSFQLADEAGNGKPYGGLAYVLTDTEGNLHKGTLDKQGAAKHSNIPCGGAILSFSQPYTGNDDWYKYLTVRGKESKDTPLANYALPITQLQYLAEQTVWLKEFEKTIRSYPDGAIKHHQMEVRDFVEKTKHLPTFGYYSRVSYHKPEWQLRTKILGVMPQDRQKKVPKYGVGLEQNKHHILEIKALRALRPKLSLTPEFSIFNLYQLGFFAAMSYKDFGEYVGKGDPAFTYEHAINLNGYALNHSIGNTLNDEWARYKEPLLYGKAVANKQEYAMFLEDAPYSKRFEVVPFDPELYPQNSWNKKVSTREKPLAWNVQDRQETPQSVHFFDDSMLGYFGKEGTHTQGFVTHNDQVVIVSVRGTQEFQDFITDANAEQVPIDGYSYKANAHKGFHAAYKSIRPFIAAYLNRFHFGQKIIVVGHSLGGAIATLLAEWVRQQKKYTNGDNEKVILYTFGSPRVGDVKFLTQSKLIHHRTVAENDPIPSVPGSWLTNGMQALIKRGVSGYIIEEITGSNTHSLYAHHGKLRHFTNLSLHNPRLILDELMWEPGCEGRTHCSKHLEVDAGLPNRVHFGRQLFNMSDHFMFNSYIPFAYATLKRWDKSLTNCSAIVSRDEIKSLETRLNKAKFALQDLKNSNFSNIVLDTLLLAALPAIQIKRNYDRNSAISELKEQIDRLQADLDRAYTYVVGIATRTNFYGGDVADNSQIEGIYAHWLEQDKKCRRPRPYTLDAVQND